MDRPQPPPQPQLDLEQSSSETPGVILNYTTSPVLRELDPSLLPNPQTICMRCPHAMWMLSGTGLACYCEKQGRMSWTVAEPVQLLNCDGPLKKN